eukprot:TRINITY_DN2075_c0_g1_i1.p1 TRINITY_DN2075_c0_g1~~TRINITY_DN2075_c0_g1_i1.p1  ORF type:complete len:121 (-),score=11.42 TRINITY_DN2075_c0_g1_i1:137-499(-)
MQCTLTNPGTIFKILEIFKFLLITSLHLLLHRRHKKCSHRNRKNDKGSDTSFLTELYRAVCDCEDNKLILEEEFSVLSKWIFCSKEHVEHIDNLKIIFNACDRLVEDKNSIGLDKRDRNV